MEGAIKESGALGLGQPVPASLHSRAGYEDHRQLNKIDAVNTDYFMVEKKKQKKKTNGARGRFPNIPCGFPEAGLGAGEVELQAGLRPSRAKTGFSPARGSLNKSIPTKATLKAKEGGIKRTLTINSTSPKTAAIPWSKGVLHKNGKLTLASTRFRARGSAPHQSSKILHIELETGGGRKRVTRSV